MDKHYENEAKNSHGAVKLALRFIEAINLHSLSGILDLMHDDHTFTNSQGKTIKGKEELVRGWLKYFELFPDYHIEVQETIQNGSLVAIFGYASGTYKSLAINREDNFWRLPSSWKAEVQDGKVLKWQVYSDNLFPFNIISKNQ